MQVAIVKTAEEGSLLAASVFISHVKAHPECVLGLATGSTPVKLYKELIRAHKEEGLDFSKVKTFNLDEYLGLPADHDQSYHYFMKSNLFDFINIDQSNCHVPDGMAADIDAFCDLYEDAIARAGGIDIQLLGIGSDGHIAFNEPGCSLACRTHTQVLTRQTIEDNARLFFGGDESKVPTQSVTMGIGTIMDARKCVLLAFGAGKADAVAGMLEGPITTMNPSSILQMHNDTLVIIDEAAAAKLKMTDYYRYMWEQTGIR